MEAPENNSGGSTINNVRDFVIDYIDRHKHPLNAALHIVGVPMVFYGIYQMFTCCVGTGFALIVVGYYFQYLGHRAQGNEVGEVTLIKHIAKRLTQKSSEK